MSREPPEPKSLFQETPSDLRRLVLLLYSGLGPVYVGVIYMDHAPERPAWVVPALGALITLAVVSLLLRPRPKAIDWILPTVIVPTASMAIAAMSSGPRGIFYMAVLAAPIAGAAVLSETFVVWIAWAAGAIAAGVVLTHRLGLGMGLEGTLIYAALHGLIAWIVHGKARLIRTLHQETRERAQRYEALLAAIPDTIVRGSADGTFLDVHSPPPDPATPNRNAVPAPASSLIGRKVYDFVPVDVADQMRAALRRALETGHLQTIEYSVSHGSGGPRDFESRFVRSGKDEVIVLRRDVTERKSAERALRESEETYRLVLGAVSDGVIVRHRDGQILAANRAAADLFGGDLTTDDPTFEMPLLREDGSPLPPDDRPRNITLRTGEALRDVVVGHRLRDGTIRWLSTSTEPLRRPNEDSPYAVVLTLRDVTEKRLAQRRQLREARLAGLEQRINEIELVMTEDGVIVAANDRAALAYGVDRASLIGRRIREIRASEARGDVSQRLAQLSREGSIRFETRHARRDGTTFPVLVSSRTFTVDGEVFIHSLIRDLTDENRLHEQLLRSQKMESIGRLAGTIAHDFNNLLTVIQSYATMLEADLPEDDPRREEVDEILAAASRATALTRRLLAASRRQIRAPRELALCDVVSDALPSLRRIVGAGVEIEIDGRLCEWGVHLDRAQIEQVLHNVASNAREAMPEGGRLRIAVSQVTNPADPDVFGTPPPPGDYVVLTVSDTGRGIDARTRERLFEPVLTTRDATKTTGLGLAEVHGIVTQSSGHVAVTSKPGEGAAFRFYFPRYRAPETPASLPKSRGAAAGEATILVVDDDAEVRAVTRRLLVREKYRVLEAADGDEALKLYSKHRDDIALILTDVAMPHLSGPELVARLDQSGLERPPVIFMSAYVDTASVGIDKLPASSTFIAKPFDKGTLLALIAAALPPPPSGAAAA